MFDLTGMSALVTGVERFAEFGGKVLTPLVKRIVADVDTTSVVTMDDIEASVR